MERKVVNFFTKHQLQPTNILYITKEDHHTMVRLKDGTTLETTIPLKYFLPALPEGGYLNITKGVVISSADIEKIEGNVYTMRDGTTFTGRVRGLGEHKANRKALENHPLTTNRLISETIFQQFSVMDHLPMPFCVFELVFNDEDHGVDFVFRYCNEALAKHEGHLREELLDRPHDEIFQRPDKKWALAYMEVALTGTSCSVHDIHPETGIPITVHCFQPGKNLCACLMLIGEN